MWYVIQVRNGREDSMAKHISRVVPRSVLEEAFAPKYATQMKVRGTWIDCERLLFPGYIIAISSDPEALETELMHMQEYAHVLMQGDAFVPLAPEEVELIGGFTQPGHRTVPMSMGIKEGATVTVTQGPLVGHEYLIKKINRRKSVAYLEVEFCGRRVVTPMGLGVLSAEQVAFSSVGDSCVEARSMAHAE